MKLITTFLCCGVLVGWGLSEDTCGISCIFTWVPRLELRLPGLCVKHLYPLPSHPFSPLSYPFARAECLSTLLLIKNDQLSLGRLILIDKTNSDRARHCIGRQMPSWLTLFLSPEVTVAELFLPMPSLGLVGISVVSANSSILHTVGKSHQHHLTGPFASKIQLRAF